MNQESAYYYCMGFVFVGGVGNHNLYVQMTKLILLFEHTDESLYEDYVIMTWISH
jgi:hypothetical protein